MTFAPIVAMAKSGTSDADDARCVCGIDDARCVCATARSRTADTDDARCFWHRQRGEQQLGAFVGADQSRIADADDARCSHCLGKKRSI